MFLKTTFQMHFRMMHERCHQTGASRSVLKKELKSILKYSSYICADTALRLLTKDFNKYVFLKLAKFFRTAIVMKTSERFLRMKQFF